VVEHGALKEGEYRLIVVRADGQVVTTTISGYEAESFCDRAFTAAKGLLANMVVMVFDGPDSLRHYWKKDVNDG
jgi:hypothetical protein